MSLILFDFDGVLADTLGDMLHFAQETCHELGVRHIVTQDNLSSLETMSFAEYGRKCEVPEPLVEEFVRRCLEKFAEKESPPVIFDGLAEVVRELAERHTLAIVTGNTAKNVTAFLAAHGLESHVRAIFGVDAPGSKVEKIERARGQLAREHEAVFMVGDSLSDVRAAREASVKSIAVGWGHQSLERLRSAQPDFVIHSPGEIIEVVW
jgi:phosphoglycolate phosphatase